MFVITAQEGERLRNERSYSHASTTSCLPGQGSACDPSSGITPPQTNDGPNPAPERIHVIIEVVVVFPWQPAIAIVCFSAESRPSISAYFTTGMLPALASTISGWSSLTAAVRTTSSTPSRHDSSW